MVRVRMARQDRLDQLVSLAWTIVRDQGADALTLGHLAEVADVAKPVVYSHFSSRASLLVALFEEYDARQSALLEESLAGVDTSPTALARAIATSYVDCVLNQGRELSGVAAALEGTPELAEFKLRSDEAYSARCREILMSSDGEGAIPSAAMTAIFGAADALSGAAAAGRMSRDDALDELTATIVATVARHR